MSVKTLVLSLLISLTVITIFLAGILVINQTREKNSLSIGYNTEVSTTTPKAVIYPTSTALSTRPDPIVECGTEWQRKNNKMTRVKKSLCDSYIDCQLDQIRVVRASKESCDAALAKIQAAMAQLGQASKNQSDIVNCQLQEGWVVMKKEECVKAQEEWKNEIEKEVIEDQIKQENELIDTLLGQ